MQMKPGNFCPLLKGRCVELKCAWFINVKGMKVNTGEEVDEWGCSMAWLPHLMIDGTNQQRQTGAAVESFRNEMIKANSNSRQLELAFMQPYEQAKRIK